MNELRELAVRRLEELGDETGPLSIRAAAERSGGLVSHETLRSIVRGDHTNRITDRTAEGLSRALSVPVDRVYAAARVPRPRARWHWPEKFDRLDESERRLVEDVANALLNAREKGLRGR